MKIRTVIYLLLVLLGTGALPAQEFGTRDFLTDHEIDLIREAQDPRERIPRYLHFAKLRLELVRQALTVEKPGRSVGIHRNLNDYGRIVETIDVVIDDALARKIDISKTIAKATEEEQQFLAALQSIADNPAEDHWRYEFVLEDAIEITQDSIELSMQELDDRTRTILEADAQERRERERLMTPERQAEVSKAKKQQEDKEAEEKRKRPTLLKPGEKLGRQP